ncbi:S8 family peptidase, partial [Mycolicibacterium sp.]
LALIETAEAMPAAIDEYVPVRLSFARIQDLVAFDLEIADPKRVIHRVWPNFAVHGQMDVSCRTVKADAVRRSFNARGNGIVWAVIDSGIDATHPHFAAGNTLRAPEVADLHRDFTLSTTPDAVTAESALCDGDSRQGHGTAVASIIAGYLPADYAAGQLSVTATELGVDDRVISTPRQVAPSELCGMAPEALLVSLKVFSDDGDDSNTDRVMAALRYVMEVNARHETRPRIHGVNLSLGYRFDPEWFACGQSPLCRYVDRLVRSGVTVVVAAGNTGYASFTTQFAGRRSGGLPMSINDPGNAERAITVGATHRSAPHTYGVSYFSSKGPTGDGRRKPDLVAPGERVTAATAITAPVAQRDATYAEFSGTSFAAPHVSGVIAAFLSVRPEFVSQPEKVKQILMAAATPLGREPHFEGAGLVDAMRALQSV